VKQEQARRPRATWSTHASSNCIQPGLLEPRWLGLTSSQKRSLLKFLRVCAGLADHFPLVANPISLTARIRTEPVGGLK